MTKFITTPSLPPQSLGNHFHLYSSGYLLDFCTPVTALASSAETGLYALDLERLTWIRMAEGKDLFNPNYRWHYCTMNPDGTQAWLIGCPPVQPTGTRTETEELLSDVLHVDLDKIGIIGNSLHGTVHASASRGPTSDTVSASHLSAMGADFARCFDQPPEAGSGADFIVTGNADIDVDPEMEDSESPAPSRPIHVHKLILQARWPHFARLYRHEMLEFHTKKLHLDESYSTTRAFLYYLYTDSIATRPQEDARSFSEPGPSIVDVAGMLVMANMYDMPRLRGLCVDRLGKELDIEHAAIIWEKALMANEDWLRKRAAQFCMKWWGRVVQSEGFRNLSQSSLVELCQEADFEGSVVNALEPGKSKIGQRGRTSGSVMVVDDDGIEEEDADMDMA